MKTLPKIILAAIAFTVIGVVINTAVSMLTMSYYMDPAYFSVWSKLMMPEAGPPPVSFYAYSIAFSFVIALIFAGVYTKVSDMIKSGGARKGLRYGFGLFLVAGIPYFLTNLLLINLPLGLSVVWLLSSLVIYLIGGIVIAKILK